MIYSFSVHAPNGRRHHFKMNQNTTILEVLEKVCEKCEVPAKDYSLRHHRRILNPSSTIQFSSFPQNATLELDLAPNTFIESDVNICVQLDSGDRVQCLANPSATIWEFLNKATPEVVGSMKNPTVIYMRRQITGKEELEKTTIRYIGLIGGSAMIRLTDTSKEALSGQANISTPLLRPQPVQETQQEVSKKPTESEKQVVEDSSTLEEPPAKISVTNGCAVESESSSSELCKIETDTKVTVKAEREDCKHFQSEDLEESKRPRTSSPAPPLMEKVILLGKRNAVAYNMHLIPPALREDLSDDFYELSVNEIQRLAAASTRALKDLIDAPLLTSAQRKLDENGLILQKLSSYKTTVVRIRFPDRTVLQGCFTSVETVGQVKEFVKEYLEDDTIQFYLYTTPPKQILKEELCLVEANCVPNAILYFGILNESKKPDLYLKAEVTEKFSSFSAVSNAMGLNEEEFPLAKQDDNQPSSFQQLKSTEFIEPKPSTSHSIRSENAENQGKVPKWFKFRK